MRKRRGPLLTPEGQRLVLTIAAIAFIALMSWLGVQNADREGQRASRIFFENLNEE